MSYVLCPCHLPVTLGLLAAAFGGSAFGAAITGQSVAVGAVLVVLYLLVLWRGFRSLRRAKALAGPGGSIACSPNGCEVVPGPGKVAGLEG